MKVVYVLAVLTVIAWALFAYTREMTFSWAGLMLLGFLFGRLMARSEWP